MTICNYCFNCPGGYLHKDTVFPKPPSEFRVELNPLLRALRPKTELEEYRVTCKANHVAKITLRFVNNERRAHLVPVEKGRCVDFWDEYSKVEERYSTRFERILSDD